MDVETEPFIYATPSKGSLKGLSILGDSGKPKCRRFGGVPYALPITAAQRWKKPTPLPAIYRYDDPATNPSDHTGNSAECPQPPRENHTISPDEDCLRCNIWMPATQKPSGGWPVFFYIHGGYLQWGSPNWENAANLFSETDVECIIVAPAYRLNVFGFLASHELLQEASTGPEQDRGVVGNIGFWDQRTALEWTYHNIEDFGGNKHNITVGGLSAGAYSTFHQLAHELGLPDDQAIIRRVVMWSNGSGLQPKSLSEYQSHFDQLLDVLKIPRDLSGKEKLLKLRSLPWKDLLAATEQLPENSFRAVADGQFIRLSLFKEIESGELAGVMVRRGIKMMVGNVRDEINSYREISPPSSYETLVSRLAVEYPEAAAKKLTEIYCPTQTPPQGGTWQDVFGRVYADMQVHVSQRGLLGCLARTLPLSSIYRYRINWRPKCVDVAYEPEMGVAHGTDLFIWFFGQGYNLLPSEKTLIQEFLKPYASYLKGEEIEWGTTSIKEARTILADGSLKVVDDDYWDKSQEIWQELNVARLAM